MDVEAWIIARLEPVVAPPDAPAEVSLDGPGGLVVRAEAVWLAADNPDGACRGVIVEVSVTDRPAGRFIYVASQSGRRAVLDHLEHDEAARIAAAIEGEPAASIPRDLGH
jgi:hypothetical protein